jgi:(4S)-4-hydroxy-5-phosphonooxypentane-2,3-dione isomerase
MFVLMVDIVVKEGYAEKFRDAIIVQGKTSLEQEEGCMRFDILQTPGEPNHFTLCEAYTDEATFNTEHRTTAHYARYAETTVDWVESKSRRTYERIWPED